MATRAARQALLEQQRVEREQVLAVADPAERRARLAALHDAHRVELAAHAVRAEQALRDEARALALRDIDMLRPLKVTTPEQRAARRERCRAAAREAQRRRRAQMKEGTTS
ncbi:MAG TPA: hypothetical protein VMS55_03080 [Myxococcota bacterium]|nr:hypothetical protein [Myxococcota bacterium]